MFIDTHAHLTDAKFNDIDNLIQSFEKHNISKVICAGNDVQSSIDGEKLAKIYQNIFFTCGLHPTDYCENTVNNYLDVFSNLVKNKKCVAVGEIGLDYHYDDTDKERQKRGFLEQIDFAYQHKMPIVIHSRDDTFDMLNLLKQNKNKLKYGFVLHCYSHSADTAKELLKLDAYFSFTGTVTFKNAKKLVEAVKVIPLDKILTETDSPYLSPEPVRGQINSPLNIPYIADKLAFIKGVDLETMTNQVIKNAQTVFTKLK